MRRASSASGGSVAALHQIQYSERGSPASNMMRATYSRVIVNRGPRSRSLQRLHVCEQACGVDLGVVGRVEAHLDEPRVQAVGVALETGADHVSLALDLPGGMRLVMRVHEPTRSSGISM